MISEDLSCVRLLELNVKINFLEKLISKNNLVRKEYVKKNEANQALLERLKLVKKEHEYVKELLYRDFFRNSANAGKRKLLLRHKLNEYYKKNDSPTKLRYYYPPVVLELQEIRGCNEKLTHELLLCNELLKCSMKEHKFILSTFKKKFISKVIEFSNIMMNWNL